MYYIVKGSADLFLFGTKKQGCFLFCYNKRYFYEGENDAPDKIVFTRRKLNQYFPKYMSTPERERIIISLLEKCKEEYLKRFIEKK